MKEEAAADGSISVVLNAQDEVCLLHKAGGLGLSLAEASSLALNTAWSGPMHVLASYAEGM